MVGAEQGNAKGKLLIFAIYESNGNTSTWVLEKRIDPKESHGEICIKQIIFTEQPTTRSITSWRQLKA